MNSLVPFIVLGVIILFVYAFVREARKQKKAASSLFKKFAGTHSWIYNDEDSGIIQELIKDFQAIGRFYSPSLGKLTPKNVIIGSVPQGTIYFFQHYRRLQQGHAFQFNVCLLQLNHFVSESLVIRFKKGKSRITNDFYTDSELSMAERWTRDITIYGKNQEEAASLLDDMTVKKLIDHANTLPWRTDLQIRKNLIAVYIAERNADIEKDSELLRLIEFTKNVAKVFKDKKFKEKIL